VSRAFGRADPRRARRLKLLGAASAEPSRRKSAVDELSTRGG